MLLLYVGAAFAAGFVAGGVLCAREAYREGVRDAAPLAYREGWHDGLAYAANRVGESFPALREPGVN